MPVRTPTELGLSLVLAGVFMAVGCGRSDKGAAGKGGAGSPRTVQTVLAETQPMERRVTALGSLAAHDQAVLSAKVPGRLASIRVDLGSVVNAGEALASIETQDYELKLRQAGALLAQARARIGLPLEGSDDRIELAETSTVKESAARLDESRRNRERFLKLNVQGVISASELESAEAQHKVADNQHQESLSDARTRVATVLQRRAEYDLARQQLADSTVLAPFEGAVQERTANLGEYLNVGAPILQLVRLDPLRLRLEIPEREAGAISQNQPVFLMVSGDARQYSGVITRISPAITEANRMLVVEADVPQQGTLRPGAFARAQIVTHSAELTLAVPTNALVTFAGIEKIFVVEKGMSVEKPVTSGRVAGGYVEIVRGLKAGEEVILDPGNLQTGNPVTTAGPTPLGGKAGSEPKPARGS